MKSFWKTALALLILTAKADIIDIGEVNKEKFLSCANVPANELIVFTLCNFENWVGKFIPHSKIKITSSLRDKSQHHGDGERSNAVDFCLSEMYTGEECADLRIYLVFVGLLAEYLYSSSLSERVGIGYYFNNKKYGSKIIHIDFRGRASRWGYWDDRQISTDKFFEKIDDRLKLCF